MSEKMVKVRVLQSVGRHMAGTKIEVPESEADMICREVSINDGHGVKKVRRAILESEAQKQDELSTTGKNIVITPADPQYEAFLAMLKKSQAEAAPGPGVAGAAPVAPVETAPAGAAPVEPVKKEKPVKVEAPAEVKAEAAPEVKPASIHPDVEPVKKEKPVKAKE
jgi:hypothetical protein